MISRMINWYSRNYNFGFGWVVFVKFGSAKILLDSCPIFSLNYWNISRICILRTPNQRWYCNFCCKENASLRPKQSKTWSLKTNYNFEWPNSKHRGWPFLGRLNKEKIEVRFGLSAFRCHDIMSTRHHLFIPVIWPTTISRVLRRSHISKM